MVLILHVLQALITSTRLIHQKGYKNNASIERHKFLGSNVASCVKISLMCHTIIFTTVNGRNTAPVTQLRLVASFIPLFTRFQKNTPGPSTVKSLPQVYVPFLFSGRSEMFAEVKESVVLDLVSFAT